ncbi:MAG TPA: pectinesterase family protein [Pyrinomonadaceae bacterium]|nr:pectinesterase family protein [Pyrinomonadaceae bacterium]
MNHIPMTQISKTAGSLLVGLLVSVCICAGRAQAFQADATVAPDGDGQFKSIQDAINAAPQTTSSVKPWTIRIKPGIYKENIYVQREKRFVRLVGEDAAKTILTYNLNANLPGSDGKPIGTFRTPSTVIDADDFTAENLTFENSAGPVGQALAIRIDGDRATFRKCRFLGWQDTILANRGRHYFEDCYIAGHVDFIFGGATVFFERCHIHCLRNGYITAASTPTEQAFGFVFSHCKITGESPEVKTYLGRPWRPFASVIFLNTEMSDVVRPVGWHNWDKPDREKTSRYAEFRNTGPGAQKAERAPWSRELSATEARNITVEKVLRGHDGWNPVTRAVAAERTASAANNATGKGSKASPSTCTAKAGLRKDVEYTRASGESLRLDACVPDGKGPFPAVILVHGGGWTGGDKAKGVDPLFAPLTKAGVAWFSINYRHAPKYPFPSSIEDVESAIRWVREHAAEFNIDPRRLALVGESAGGHLVAMAAVRAREDTRVAAVVPFYAPVDLLAESERRGGLSLSLRALLGRSFQIDEQAVKLLREASPINYVHAGLPPFLILHGTADMSVLYNQSVQLQAKLKAAGVACELVTIDDGVHGMARWEATAPSYKDKVASWIAEKLSQAPATSATNGEHR